MTVETDRRNELAVTAWHEAGHVTAYLSKGLPVRYATLRPRGGDAVGRTLPAGPRMLPYWDIAVISLAGPVAQGMYEFRTRAEDDGLTEDDYIFGAYLTGGSCDAQRAAVAPQQAGPDGGDLWEWTSRRTLEPHWPVVTAIAEALQKHMTVSGRALRELALSAAAAADIPESFYWPRSGR